MKFYEKMVYVFLGMLLGFSISTQVHASDANNEIYCMAQNIYFEEIGRAHVRTPVTEKSRMPSSA